MKSTLDEITIEPNDAFEMLKDITRDHINNLPKFIVKKLYKKEFIEGVREDCGKSLDQIANQNDVTIYHLIKKVFPTVKYTDEIPELSKYIFLVWNSANNPCPECGCELDFEFDGGWENTKCSNFDCDFATTTEPDHDNEPGGHSFNQ